MGANLSRRTQIDQIADWQNANSVNLHWMHNFADWLKSGLTECGLAECGLTECGLTECRSCLLTKYSFYNIVHLPVPIRPCSSHSAGTGRRRCRRRCSSTPWARWASPRSNFPSWSSSSIWNDHFWFCEKHSQGSVLLRFYSINLLLRFFKHSDWLKKFSIQSKCLKNSIA